MILIITLLVAAVALIALCCNAINRPPQSRYTDAMLKLAEARSRQAKLVKIYQEAKHVDDKIHAELLFKLIDAEVAHQLNIIRLMREQHNGLDVTYPWESF